MRKMSHLVFASLALFTISALIIGCHGCYRANSVANSPKNSNGVPVVIADAKLLCYEYTKQGTMRWPLHSEKVELCNDDSTRCIIRLFDDIRFDNESFDSNGDPIPDTLIVSSEVLDTIKQMIIDAEAWRFKDSYSPRVKTLDGNSWDFSASFAVTDSALAAIPEAQRSGIIRNGISRLTSEGFNASPDTKLFEQVRLYLQGVYDSEKSK